MNKTLCDERYQKLISELTKTRIRLNIPQSEIAVRLGLNQSDVSKIEKFDRRLDVLELAILLDALGGIDDEILQGITFDFIRGING